MEPLPNEDYIRPRFWPDNSPEARAKRMAMHSWGGALITETPMDKTPVTPDDFAMDHALCYIYGPKPQTDSPK